MKTKHLILIFISIIILIFIFSIIELRPRHSDLTLRVPKNGTYNASVGNIIYGLGNNDMGASLKLTLSINGNDVNTFIPYENVKTITGFGLHWDVAISPNGEYAYVTNYNSNTISMVNLTSDAIVNTIKGFDFPWSITVSPNGYYIYVVNFKGNNMKVYTTYKSIYKLPLNPGTYKVNVSTSGNSNYNSNSILKIFKITIP